MEVAGDLRISHTTVNRFEVGVVSDAALLSGSSLYISQIREFIAPIGGLQGRQRELEVLAEFCRGRNPYLWIRARPWAGKSALLAWFALYPPPAVTVIAFFVTDRLADQNDHTAFTAAILDQLAVLLPDQRALIAAATINRDGLRNELLTTAADREATAGRRLVLVVDGLDEDTGKPPIVSLLPARPPENLRVVVASRYGPRLRVSRTHPLTGARRYALSSSPFAADVRDLAVAELDALLSGPAQHRDLLALITAANGLTGSELTELTDMAPFEIDGLLRTVAGRSFRTRTFPAGPHGVGDPVYVLAHETLQRTSEQRLGASWLRARRDRLHAWADHYRELRWPADTPDFFLRRYFPILDRHDDLPRMTALALDVTRHSRIRARTGGDQIALGEIRAVQQRICDQPDPDLLVTARLARHRDHLHDRNAGIPQSLLPLWARLGDPDRAEALARSISDPVHQAHAFTGITAVVTGTDIDRADRLADRAEVSARSIPDPTRQAEAIARLARVVANVDPDRAEALIRTVADPARQAHLLADLAEAVAGRDCDRAEAIADGISLPWPQAYAFARIADAVAGIDPDRAGRLADRAETVVRDNPARGEQAEVLTHLAALTARIDPGRAGRLAEEAATIAADSYAPGQRAGLLARVAEVLAGTDPDRAEAIVRTLPAERQADALSRVAAAIAGADPDRAETIVRTLPEPAQQAAALATVAEIIANIDPGRAARLATAVEALARTLPDSGQQADALAGAARVLAGADPERAEALARDNPYEEQRAEALAAVAEKVAATDPDRAGRLADDAETLARDIVDAGPHAAALVELAEAMARIDPDLAETLARTIPDLEQQAGALAEIAEAVADIDPDRAETLARTIVGPWQTYALAGVAEAIAGADPDRAEMLAREFTDPAMRGRVLAALAEAVAGIDPDRAGRLIGETAILIGDITDQLQQTVVFTQLIEAAAVIDADRAEAFARALPDPGTQAEIFAALALPMASVDPDRAGRLVDEATTLARDLPDPQQHTAVLIRAIEAVSVIAPNRRGRLIDEATTLARDIPDPQQQAGMLADLATAVAVLDADRAETLARDIRDPREQAEALTRVAAATAGPAPRRSRHLLALAWSIARWEIPISALPVVDFPVLRALVSDTTDEQPQQPTV
ncbi:hypothetical protein [Nocardia sp. BMG111209]|uniref:hypothetical protein n=1 Tax=Nocardia sp. BMG111209 TaxID=1160137 RepID=UPI00036866B6|nr:hypothetical protein [Nocardia sp. BMG111209]